MAAPVRPCGEPAGRLRLAGRSILVVGGSTGIGRATVERLHAAGAQPHVAALADQDLAALGASGVVTYGGDVADASFVNSVAEAAACDALVYCAGLAMLAPFLDGRFEDWERMFSVNLLAAMRFAQTVAPGMVARGGGQMVFVTSALAHAVYPNTTAYAATKHGLSALCRGLRLELGSQRIRVSEVRPGLVGSTAIRVNSGSAHPAAAADLATRPYAPIAPDDIARGIVFALEAGDGVDVELVEIKPTGQP